MKTLDLFFGFIIIGILLFAFSLFLINVEYETNKKQNAMSYINLNLTDTAGRLKPIEVTLTIRVVDTIELKYILNDNQNKEELIK
jgi:hypothetical protein